MTTAPVTTGGISGVDTRAPASLTTMPTSISTTPTASTAPSCAAGPSAAEAVSGAMKANEEPR